MLVNLVNQIITAATYFLLIVLAEISLYYLSISLPSIADYAMLIALFGFLGLAWLLKLKFVALILSVNLNILYGVLSFYYDFPIYHVGYPDSFVEFLPLIGIKTAFYTFPLIAFLALGKKKPIS